MHMVNKPSLVHNSHCSEWCCEKQLQDLNLCSNVTSEQIWQMDYLNMWASNHRVQSSNPSDTGSAKHTAELRDKDPNHDKSVHSSTTALSHLKPAIKRVILARWVCQSEEWKRSKADTSEDFMHRLSLWAHTAVLVSSHMNRGSCFMTNLLPQSSDSYAEKKNESLKSAAGKLKTANKCHAKTFWYYFPKALTFLWWEVRLFVSMTGTNVSYLQEFVRLGHSDDSNVSVCRCSFELLIVGIKTSAYTSHPQQWNHCKVSNNNHLVLALF